MNEVLIFLGLILVVFGAAVWALGGTGFRGLPSDIQHQGQRIRFYLWNWLNG
jgi:hypothetical protein